MEKDTTSLGGRVAFTVRVFFNFISRNILKFSLVHNLLHIKEGGISFKINWLLKSSSAKHNIQLSYHCFRHQILPYSILAMYSVDLCYLFALLLCAVGTGVDF